jgi:hypothetical protein
MDAGKFRLAETTVGAVRSKMVEHFLAQRDAEERLAALRTEQADLKAAGKTALAEAKADEIGVAERELRDFAAVGEQLDQMLAGARRTEAGQAAMTKVGAAQESIEKYNFWFEKHYQKHANAILEGLKLEQEALEHIRALNGLSEALAALPPLSKSFVGNEARSLSALCRLPSGAGWLTNILGTLKTDTNVTAYVCRGRTVMTSDGPQGPGTELNLPVEEARHLMKLGFLQASLPVLLPPAEYNPAGVGLQAGTMLQGPKFR